MNLFKSELFNPTTQPGPYALRSYREPRFAPRYGRRRAVLPLATNAVTAGAVLAFEARRIGDELVLLEFDRAA